MEKKRRAPLRVRILAVLVYIVLPLVVLAGLAAFIYVHNYYHASDRAMEALASPPPGVTVEEQDGDWITFGPADADAAAGVIFYPGGKVQYEAYAPLMEEMAQQGLFCVLVHMPGNLAVLDKDAAADVIEAYPGIDDWYIGGHSLGGVMAAGYASKHPEEFEGIFLLAAYTTRDLSQSDLKGLRVYGSEDRVLNYDSLEKNEENLPQKQFRGFVIQGGNHAQFGDYGAQKGDGEATIPAEEQWRITAEALAELTEDQ
ncbi:MAG: alpha/beta hydrolase [Firmicutes bacterium]|nr:alpha/beta hydrolase [Bacillota bacterium]